MDSNDIGWDRLVDAIDVKFGIEDHGRNTEPLPDQPDLTQHVSYVIFIKGGRRFKMERISRPAILERKSHYHKAAGAKVRFETVYDPTELTHVTNFYAWDNADWQPIEASQLALN